MPAPAQQPASAPRAVLARPRQLLAGTPLRIKLVAAVLLLVVIALLGSGAAARATLGRYLIGRVDSQLAGAEQGIAEHGLGMFGFGGSHGPGGVRGSDEDQGNEDDPLPSAYVVEVTGPTGNVITGPTSNLLDSSQPLPALPHPSAIETERAGTHTFTVSAVHGDEQWRVLAAPVRLSDGSAGTLLIAQSLEDIQNTIDHLTALLAVIGATAVVIIAAVGYLIVRMSLRPLRDVEHTAADIAAGDLSHRVSEAHPRTEVGHLSVSLNTMLAEIETAFAERAASEEAARRSEERMRRFIADASHELRTPLTTIRGFAELYRHGAAADEDEVRRLMRRIEDEAKHMGLLVEDLLLLARLDQQRPLARDPVDLLALAGDAVQGARAVAPDRPIGLRVLSADPPPVVIGDEARLRQVLGNLLTNALTHTPAGTPVTVTVTTGPGERTHGQAAVLSVADEGPGLSPEATSRVFERFYRADAARSRADGGTGLGLAIVAALVAGHGGFVDVESTPGAGTCFRVELPLAKVPALPAPATGQNSNPQ